ncbi:staphylococcal enterotoxin type C3 [Staphylococcus aureus]|uniref:staphylococcal enterotoxin type C3 n=1 Tax=Staphylococcus aureus TaxID=1280 RepID=UPI0006BADB58|nr:staphylococcal enterotoxin type C3 [Staphylococcus aureus]
MYKRLFISRVILIFALILVISTPNVLAESQPDPMPDDLHKSSEFTGTMGNMKYLYDDHYVSATKVKSVDKFLAHDLIYNISDKKLKNYDKVKTELLNEDLAKKYKDEIVDVYGSNYYVNCYFSSKDNVGKVTGGKTCMYGGITKHEGNHFDNGNLQNVLVRVYENKRNTISFEVQTDKKSVTAQELDIKARNFLINKKNLYEFNSSPYETGYIKFIENNGNTFWYDMMPAPGDKFDQSKYLMMYNDNKTVDSKSVKIEVHLTTKNG